MDTHLNGFQQIKRKMSCKGWHISLIDSVIDVAQWLVITYYTVTDSVV